MKIYVLLFHFSPVNFFRRMAPFFHAMVFLIALSQNFYSNSSIVLAAESDDSAVDSTFFESKNTHAQIEMTLPSDYWQKLNERYKNGEFKSFVCDTPKYSLDEKKLDLYLKSKIDVSIIPQNIGIIPLLAIHEKANPGGVQTMLALQAKSLAYTISLMKSGWSCFAVHVNSVHLNVLPYVQLRLNEKDLIKFIEEEKAKGDPERMVADAQKSLANLRKNITETIKPNELSMFDARKELLIQKFLEVEATVWDGSLL